jgi:phage terminase large subunit-like protein
MDFLSCEADLALFGGSAYGGKSTCLLLDVLRYINTPGWTGLMLRRNANDHQDASSIYEKAKRFFSETGRKRKGQPRRDDPIFRGGAYMDVRWPSGATLIFRHVDDKKIESYQGAEYAWIGVDEVTHFDLLWLRFLITRMRSHSGVKTRMRMSCNPDPDHPIAEWVDPHYVIDGGPRDGEADRTKSGKIRYWATDGKGQMVWGETRDECATRSGRPPEHVKTFAFIAASLEDNVIGQVESPEYEANLASAGPVLESRLRHGNWRTRAQTKGMMPLEWFGKVREPLAVIVHRVRVWDKAASKPRPGAWNPDYTAGARIEWDIHGRWYITDLVACREEAPDVSALIAATAEADGPDVTQVFEIDPGQAGKQDDHNTRRALMSGGNCGPIISAHVNKNKIVKATPMADQLRLGMDGTKPRTKARRPDEVFEPRGFIIIGTWRERPYFDAAEDHAPTLGVLFDRQWAAAFGTKKDDIPDAVSIGINSRKPPPPAPPDPLERTRRMS